MYEVAAKELDALDERQGTNPEVLASLYWAGRSYAAMGDTTRARSRWNEVIARDSMSYYADAAARRLGQSPWAPAASPDTFAVVPDLDSLARRANFLDGVMLDGEAAMVRARLGRSAASSPERLMSAADLMRRHGLPSQAISLARRVCPATRASTACCIPWDFPRRSGARRRVPASMRPWSRRSRGRSRSSIPRPHHPPARADSCR